MQTQLIKTRDDILTAKKNATLILKDLQDEYWSKQHVQLR